MLSQDKLDRINDLARKQRADGLTEDEKKEQDELRQQYIKAFRSSMRNSIEGMKIVDEEGNDLTPDKLKQIQKDKGLHDR